MIWTLIDHKKNLSRQNREHLIDEFRSVTKTEVG